jgi:ABC-type transport system involved in cytochrome c biogenesis permease subunit
MADEEREPILPKGESFFERHFTKIMVIGVIILILLLIFYVPWANKTFGKK